jgi:hypothetical protein
MGTSASPWPPALQTSAPAVLEIPYSQTIGHKYTMCAKCGDAECGVCAMDSGDGDVSGRACQIMPAKTF